MQHPGVVGAAELRVVQSDRIETLLRLAAEDAAAASTAALAPQHWLVPSQGMAQWVQQALAQQHGICAGVRCWLPAQWLWHTYRAVLGEAAVPDEAALDRGPLRWRLWRLLPTLAHRDAAVLAPLVHYLGDADDPLRRAQLARRVADLFDQYQIYRPDWLADWAAGQDRLRASDGRVRDLPPGEHWQPALWRLLRADATAEGHRWPSRCDIHAAWLQHMQAATTCPLPSPAPSRLTVFGVNSLTPDVLQALQAVACWHPVAIYVLNPARTDWFDRDGAHSGHPLLAAWGRQGREFIAGLQILAAEEPAPGRARVVLHDAWDDELPDDAAAPHLLAQLQDDLRHGRAPGERHWPPVDPARDDSLRLHVCHTMLREVEVLHDEVLAALQRDATLQPRDIAVFAPDLAAYAPLIHAVWGSLPPDDARRIPYSLADVDDTTLPRLRAWLRALLHPQRTRFSGSEGLDWLDIPAVAHAFGLSAEDRDTLRRWRREAAIRWGLDGAHRHRLGLVTEADAQAERYTWRDGLRRLWLGYLLGHEDQPWQDQIMPARGVSLLQGELLHRLQLFIDTVADFMEELAVPTDAPGWAARLHALLDQLVQPAPDDLDGSLALARLRTAVDRWAQQAAAAGSEPIAAAVVADTWLALAGAGDAGGQRFLDGGVTFATLLPMRAVPFRRVYILGLHDGHFPRRADGDTHDLIATCPRPGDRLRRHEDLYLLLEAVLSARDHLGLFWLGRHPGDGTEREPALPVAQLRHHLRRQWRPAAGWGDDVAAALTRHHALHPFDPANFSTTPVDGDEPPPLNGAFSYAREWLAAPPAPAQARRPAPAQTGAASSPLPLTALAELLHDPAQAYTRQCLGLALPNEEEDDDDLEPFAPDSLQRWRTVHAAVQAVVEAALQGADEAAALQAAVQVRRRAELTGDWPAGAPGAWLARDWDEPLRRVWRHAARLAQRHPHPLPERPRMDRPVTLADNTVRTVRGVLPPLRRGDDGALARLLVLGSALTKSKGRDLDNPAHYELHPLLRGWVEHVALNMTLGPVTSWIVSPRGVGQLQPLPPETAHDIWSTLWLAWHEGITGAAPLPLPRRAAAAYWGKLMAKPDNPGAAWDEARQTYEDPRHGLAHEPLWRRHYPTFETLAGPRDDHVQRAFARWTARLLQPLRHHLVSGHGDEASAGPSIQP
ncbi:MAG: exodeoxyribonuclease V subunit gamma [Tepidimonas sp.]|nr:exodeoxyribonuclease V subunit gamma [Tepidimonas sp.]